METGNRDIAQPPGPDQYQPDNEDKTHELTQVLERHLASVEESLAAFLKDRRSDQQEPHRELLKDIRKMRTQTKPPEKWVTIKNKDVTAGTRSDRGIHRCEVRSYLRGSIQIRDRIEAGVERVHNKKKLLALQNTLNALRESQEVLSIHLFPRISVSRSLDHSTKERRSFNALPASFPKPSVSTHHTILESRSAVPTCDDTPSQMVETSPVPASGSGIDGPVANSERILNKSGLEPECEARRTESVANSQSDLSEYHPECEICDAASILVDMRMSDRQDVMSDS